MIFQKVIRSSLGNQTKVENLLIAALQTLNVKRYNQIAETSYISNQFYNYLKGNYCKKALSIK